MKNMNKKEGKKIAVMAAIIMGLMMFAFMPAASATVTSFTVIPSTGIASAVDSYDVFVTTTGVTSINITIPAGFIAVAPAADDVVARVVFWNSSTKAYYGHATVTANLNPSEEVEVYGEFQVGGDEFEYGPTTQGVNYTAGEESELEVKVKKNETVNGTAWANITLPTKSKKGSINITIDCWSLDLLDAVTISIGEFVRNPSVAKVYDFYADGEVAHVNITPHQALGDIAYLKGADPDYDLYIYTAPTTIGGEGILQATDYWSPDGDTVAVTAIDGGDEIAYLMKGAGTEDYDLYIYTAPTTIGGEGILQATDYWSPDGNTVAITAIDINDDGVDEIAYLKEGAGGATDYDLWIYSAPTTIGGEGILQATDYWSPDGNTVAITAIDIDGDGVDKIAYLKGAGMNYDLYVYTAPTGIAQHGTLLATDYWSPDGNTVAITAIDIDGGDEIAYLKGAGTDYDLYVYTAPATVGQHGTLIATDYWSPDGLTEGISAIP